MMRIQCQENAMSGFREISVSRFYHTRTLKKLTWDKVLKNGPNKICGRYPFIKFEKVWSV